MNYLVKLAPGKPRRIHASNGQRPLCGGGNGGRSVHWQQDMAGPCNCAACQTIINRPPPI